MKRRTIITAIGGTAATWPLVAQAQKPSRPVIGFLSTLSRSQVAFQLGGFLQGLDETGFKEGRNVEIEYRFAEGEFSRLPAMAAELARSSVSLILAQAPPAAVAAKAATSTIPIVFVVGYDPVGSGLVASLHNPGGNATGMTLISTELAQKRLEVLLDLLPKASSIAILINPNSPDTLADVSAVEAGVKALKLQLAHFKVSSPGEIDGAFAAMAKQKPDALIVATDPFMLNQRQDIVTRVASLRIPAVYPFRDYVADGGLFSYGTNIAQSYHEAGVYAGRILKGAKPADLPVMRPTRFELVINLKTAKALGLTVPPSLLARADDVIE